MSANLTGQSSLLETILPTVREATTGFDAIPANRRADLESLAGMIRARLASDGKAHLTFICTHNSRRSQFAQVWAQTAACGYNLSGIKTFSGGTEATSCDTRTVAALRRAGFSVTNATPGTQNPAYVLQFSDSEEPLQLFSKIYSADGNPDVDFIAVMTCDHADANCPIVTGSAARIALPYIDPKASDDTPEEAGTYDARSNQIAREMLFTMSRVAV